MRRQFIPFFVGLGFVWAANVVMAQAPEQERGSDRGRDRGWWGGPGSNDENFSERMVDRYVQRYTRRYELNEAQQQQVKTRLQQLQAQHEVYATPLREESRALREEARELWRQRREGLEVDNERSQEIRERLREIWEGSPLLNQSNVTREVETLLPPDQVQKGQQRREQRREGFDQGGRQDQWQRYFDRFTRRYQLDASQRATAEAVLRNLTAQREGYRQAHQGEFQAAEQIQDRDERQKKIRELNEPVQKMFEELRTKLDQIPTAAQKAVAEAASRPAGNATTRPSRN